MNLEAVKVTKKTGEEQLTMDRKGLELRLKDFWGWCSSDILNNALRGVFAEFIVSSELGLLDKCRVEWDACDLVTNDGIRVEVKSAAYLQSWGQKRLSDISFKVSPTLGWDSRTNEYDTELRRQSDAYVFCLLAHKDKDTVNPLDMNQWEFYVISTRTLDEKLGKQGTMRLSTLLRLDHMKVGYGQIREAIYVVAGKVASL